MTMLNNNVPARVPVMAESTVVVRAAVIGRELDGRGVVCDGLVHHALIHVGREQ